jgi:hypothetical protein
MTRRSLGSPFGLPAVLAMRARAQSVAAKEALEAQASFLDKHLG